MGINIVVAVTDKDWFETLRSKDLGEINFWSPSAKNFQALQPGELFLFKLHAPHNAIVGGGIFLHAKTLPFSLVWEAFGEANGARSQQEMRKRIVKYRRTQPDNRSDFDIGCRILGQSFFFDEPDWIPVPASWQPNIVSYKTYNTDNHEGLTLWTAVAERLELQQPPDAKEQYKRFGEPRLFHPRLGQGAFRLLITDIYGQRCAVTQERTLPALEAAHIKPYGDGGDHEASNGLLLRRDIHKLFDDGYVTVTPSLDFEVSRQIKEKYENGRHYYALHGHKINAPDDMSKHPDPNALAWHNDTVFMG